MGQKSGSSSFMKERALKQIPDPHLLALLIQQITAMNHSFATIISIPSNTWKAQPYFIKALASQLQTIPLLNLLSWHTPPKKRQGELLNNDQRQHNVAHKMEIASPISIPKGTLLLLDDYIGSGSTLTEAVRALRKQYDHPILPITIAALKWKLGKPGFI